MCGVARSLGAPSRRVFGSIGSSRVEDQGEMFHPEAGQRKIHKHNPQGSPLISEAKRDSGENFGGQPPDFSRHSEY